MAGGYIPEPRKPAAIESDFRRTCRTRDTAIENMQFDIARWANRKIDTLLDEYLRAAPK